LDDITPRHRGDAIKRKLDHDLEPVEAQSKKLQIIAFESAGCPAAASRTDLVRWIKAATPEPTSLRSRLARGAGH
jgi:hypothetical protein